MMRILLIALVLAAPVALPGCLCDPLLEVRHCRDHQKHCAPDAADVRTWSLADQERFPEIHALLESLEVGTHGHADYNASTEAAFWEYWGLDNSAGDQELFVSYNNGIFRLRVYTCEGTLF